MKNILRKWLGIDECATFYQHCEMIKQVSELKDKLKQFDQGAAIPENSNFYQVVNRLIAIQEYLKLDINWEWENDPSRLPEPHPRIRVWKAHKRKKPVIK